MWIELTEDDVLTRLAGPELTAYKSAALAVGQADPLPEVLEGVINEVRGRVAACQANKLGDGDTIPDELKHHALAIVRYRLITRLPIQMRPERTQEYEDALSALDKVAECKFAIEAPATPSDEVISSPTPRIKKRCLKFSREKQEGV